MLFICVDPIISFILNQLNKFYTITIEKFLNIVYDTFTSKIYISDPLRLRGYEYITVGQSELFWWFW